MKMTKMQSDLMLLVAMGMTRSDMYEQMREAEKTMLKLFPDRKGAITKSCDDKLRQLDEMWNELRRVNRERRYASFVTSAKWILSEINLSPDADGLVLPFTRNPDSL